MELGGAAGPGEYVGVGLSADGRMGQDYVAYCTESTAALAVNPSGHQASTLLDEDEMREFLMPEEVGLAEGRVLCRFALNTNVPAAYRDYVPFQDLKRPLLLLFASGPTDRVGQIAQHGWYPRGPVPRTLYATGALCQRAAWRPGTRWT